jgi:hypothetical protein
MRSTTTTVIACLLSIIASASAEVVIVGQNSTTALAYAGAASATDLINAGQSTLAAATVTPNHSSFSVGGINDGAYANSPLLANTFFQYEAHFPAAATYQLNLTGAPNGYDLTSITSLMGWATVSQRQANQDYTVEVSVVGSAGYKPIARVNYAPFTGTGGSYETQVTLTENTTGVLAANVDGIRFLFGDPGNDNATPGTVVREIDVQGTPSAAAPPAVTVQTVADFSEADEAYAAEVSNNDLVNAGQTTLAGFTTSTTPAFSAGGPNDGTYGLANTTAAAWYQPAKMPATLTFELNTAAAPAGYVVSAIRTFAGWKGGGTQTYANQKYTVEYRPVGSGSWTVLETVDYSPFSTLSNTPANTRVTLTKPGGNLLTGVAALRFTLQTPTRAVGTNNGTLLQEIDVIGYPAGTPPEPVVAISSPTQRQIVQRTAANTAAIPITGTYTGTPDRIEARAVVMAGATNSGVSTAWTTLVAAPSGGAFSGSLANVTAGGWYQIEVRSVTGDTPGAATVRDKVGVGDIYVTAGQSNSTNYGSPALTPTNDRVVVRTGLTGNTWRHGYDPMPAPDGSSGGSVWSRLGGLLAAADNIPIGFLCAGSGSTATSQWTPGTSNYTNLKTGIQSFPANGFKAVLWHQGESDSIANVTAATHAQRMASIIAQSRADGGWQVPWYLAEVSFHPATHLSQEEPVTAGQRATAYADPLVFLGPTTDGFHLEDANGGKLADSVHFNAAGLADHAGQWRDILRGTTTTTPRNGDFEDNRSAAITGLAPLADGASHVVNIDADNDSPAVLGWRILAADGLNAAAGSNGFHNPTTGTYAGAVDTINGGVLPKMAGRHVAVLDGGSAGNLFLHTTRATLQPNTIYTLIAAIGVRDNPAGFGGARLDLLADGQVLATASFSKAALDALRGGDSAGTFTDASVSFMTGATVPAGQPVAVRIAKTTGTGTVLDFDTVRLTTAPASGYGAFQIKHWDSIAHPAAGRALDPDGDGIPNVIEYFMGYDPQIRQALPQAAMVNGGPLARFTVPLDPAVTDSGFEVRYSFDLQDWQLAATVGDGSVTSIKTAASWIVEVNTAAHPKTFFRMAAPL